MVVEAQAVDANSVIEIRSVTKSYQDEINVLENVSLNIERGEFLTLLGPSGCGKTSLLRLLAGFEQVSSGQIIIDKQDLTFAPPQQRHINTVFQNFALFPHMSVFENVAFGLRCRKVSKAEIEQRVNDILKTVRLSHLAQRKPEQLSGGQQQRVAVARAVINQPLVLLLDEPFSALDYRLRKNMQIELKALQRQLGITFVFVTHDQEEALSMSDRVAIMDQGEIQQIGTPREVYETPQNLYVAKFIGEANIFKSEVTAIKGHCLETNIEGTLLTLPNTKGFKIGDVIHVVVRPEDLKVWDDKEVEDKSTMLHGKVEQVIYKGSLVDLFIRLDSGRRISATQFFDEDDENLDYRINESVWVEWYAGWEVILAK